MFPQTPQCRTVIIFGERASSAQFPPQRIFASCVWTLQLDSCRRCHLATLLCDADAWLVRLPSYSAALAARTVCALTLAQRLRAVPKSARSTSQPGSWVGKCFNDIEQTTSFYK